MALFSRHREASSHIVGYHPHRGLEEELFPRTTWSNWAQSFFCAFHPGIGYWSGKEEKKPHHQSDQSLLFTERTCHIFVQLSVSFQSPQLPDLQLMKKKNIPTTVSPATFWFPTATSVLELFNCRQAACHLSIKNPCQAYLELHSDLLLRAQGYSYSAGTAANNVEGRAWLLIWPGTWRYDCFAPCFREKDFVFC